MADETTNEPTENPISEDVLKERKKANDAYALLRKRDQEQRATQETIQQLQARLDQVERGNRQQAAPAANVKARTLEELGPAPDARENPIDFMVWKDQKDDILREIDRQKSQADTLQSFALTSESIARREYPDYDQARAFLRASWQAEYEMTGELQRTAKRLLGDPGQRQNIANRMAEKGMSEIDAAKDICMDGVEAYRAAEISAAQRELGGNPAIKAYEVAKDRGYGEPARMERFGFKPLVGQPGSRTTSGIDVDESLKELERKKNLRAGTNTTADIRDGGEVPEKRAWTREQLEEAKRTNPALYKQAIQQIAADADSDPRSLQNIITR